MKTGNAIKGFYSTNLGFYDEPQGIPNAKGLVISRGAMKIEKELLTCIKGSMIVDLVLLCYPLSYCQVTRATVGYWKERRSTRD